MTRSESQEERGLPTETLVRLVHAERGRMSVRQRVKGAERLAAHLAWSRRRSRWWVPVVVSVGALALLASFLVVGPLRTRDLSYRIEGGHLGPQGAIEVEPGHQAALHFSDGSALVLEPDAKASLRSVDAHGAHVALAEGTGVATIVHWTGTHWLFDAGPFVIRVTGTAFRFRWLAAEEELDIWMDRGTVEVSDPLSAESIPVRSGQHYSARLRDHETVLRDIDDTKAPAPLPAVPPPSPSDSSGATGSADAPASPADAGRPKESRPGTENGDWPALVAAGDYASILRQAERRGFEACLAECSSADLAALADAARYGRRGEIARRALLVERRRFPRSPGGRDASFLLGRLEEAAQHLTPAIEWYDRYVAESPAGTYASEALGRKMTLMVQVHETEQARIAAAEYLRRFPRGPYATRARALTQAP